MTQQIDEKFHELRLENAMKLQKRIMELVEHLKFDKEFENNEIQEDYDDEDFFEEEESPAQTELFLLLEVYKTILGLEK